jgi:hypothetical protein
MTSPTILGLILDFEVTICSLHVFNFNFSERNNVADANLEQVLRLRRELDMWSLALIAPVFHVT